MINHARFESADLLLAVPLYIGFVTCLFMVHRWSHYLASLSARCLIGCMCTGPLMQHVHSACSTEAVDFKASCLWHLLFVV